MRRVSTKNAAAQRKWGPIRRDYLAEFPDCVICGAPSQCVHEIARGVHRQRAFCEPATWLSTCSDCNMYQLTSGTSWPIAIQLVVKLLHDPERFDLDKFNAVLAPKSCRNPPSRFDANDVLGALRKRTSAQKFIWPTR